MIHDCTNNKHNIIIVALGIQCMTTTLLHYFLGFISVVLSSLERRYQLTSVQAGLIASIFDVAVLITVIFISYFAGKGHKPRWLGVSLLVQGLGK